MACLAAAVLVAGCGSGDGETESTAVTTSSLSKAQFIKQAEAACDKSNKDMLEAMRDYGDEHEGESSPAAIAVGIKKVVPPVLESRVEEIRALGAPSGDEAQVEAYLQALEDSIRQIEDEEPESIYELQEALVTSNLPAKTYGFKGCRF
jgi:hypothetical protein